MPQEYLVPDISKEDFRSRLIAVLEGQKPSGFTEQSQQSENSGMNDASADSSASASAAPIAQTQGQASDDSVHYPQPSQKKRTGDARGERRAIKAEPWKDPAPATAASSTLPKRQPVKETQKPSSNSKSKKEQTSQAPQRSTDSNAGKTTSRPDEHLEAQPPTSRAPPSQYRLQVRLFDGSSVRSSFTPSQTIRNDVRPWLDDQMTDDHRPYNLKHILTPLSSQTLSIAEESQTLEDLDLGSTATLVMVPVQNYTDAYAGAGSSLPVRGISAAYNLVSSAAGTATGLVTGLVGSIMGYGSTQTGEPGPSDSTSDPSSSADSSRRLRSAGPNIHTFRDQQDEHGNSQLYNGNQVRQCDVSPKHYTIR